MKELFIINENDSGVEEIKIGTTYLSALAANLWESGSADNTERYRRYITKTKIIDAKLIEEVHDIESLKKEIDSAGKSNLVRAE